MPAKSYEQIVHRLYQINSFTSTKLGLENMQRLDAALGSPSRHLPIVHVAGTNGKGTVCFKTARGLEAAGCKTGLFVSPHLSCFRERIQVNKELIDEASVVGLLTDIFNACERFVSKPVIHQLYSC
jgi:dihydrofolate synthase/folylpolyglutamate synthase